MSIVSFFCFIFNVCSRNCNSSFFFLWLGLKKGSIAQDLKELKLRAQTLEGKPTDLALTEMEAGLTVVDELSLQFELQQSIVNSLVVSERLLVEVLKQGQR